MVSSIAVPSGVPRSKAPGGPYGLPTWNPTNLFVGAVSPSPLTEVFCLGKRELVGLGGRTFLPPDTVFYYSPALGTLAVKSILDGFFSATYEKRKADAPVERQLLLCGSHPTSGRLGFFWLAPYGIHLLGRCSYIFASSASKPATKHQTSVLYILFDNLILFLKIRQCFLLCQNYLLYALNISLL